MYSPLVYTPTNFKQKNDLNFTLSANFIGVNGFLAYTPVNHFFILAEGNNVNSGSNRKTHTSYAAGVGSYFRIKDKFHLEFRGGYGIGKFDYTDAISGSSGSLTMGKGEYIRYYGAFSFSYTKNNKTYSLFANGGNLHNHYFSTNLGSLIPANFVLFSTYYGFIFQKTITDGIRFTTGLGANIAYKDWNLSESIFRVNNAYLNIGLSFNVNEILFQE
jgi:hypothetical protein